LRQRELLLQLSRGYLLPVAGTAALKQLRINKLADNDWVEAGVAY
jgi:hypothetical protein